MQDPVNNYLDAVKDFVYRLTHVKSSKLLTGAQAPTLHDQVVGVQIAVLPPL